LVSPGPSSPGKLMDWENPNEATSRLVTIRSERTSLREDRFGRLITSSKDDWLTIDSIVPLLPIIRL
jgi:hypothetical protein